MYARDGEVIQSGLYFDANDDKRVTSPCVGVIWRVNYSDDVANPSSLLYTDGRGHQATAEVVIVDDGSKNIWSVPNAVLPAPGPTGWQDFAEWLPKGCSQSVNGGDWSDLAITDYSYLDGTWCIVAFIGGRTTLPVVIGYLNHPRNRFDPATEGEGNDGEALEQEGRIAVRWNGTKLVVTSEGSLYLDTSGAAAEVTGSASETPVRTPTDEGGALNIAIKPTAAMEVTFNVPAESQPLEPDLLQPNPPDPAVVAKAEAQAAVERAEAEARRVAQAAANAAKSTVLQAAAGVLGPTQQAYDAAKATLGATVASQAAAAAAAAAAYQAEVAAKIAALTAAASAIPPVPGAAQELQELLGKIAAQASAAAAQAALAVQEEAEVLAAQALTVAQANAAQALRATQAAAHGLTDEDRLLPDGTYLPARTVVKYDGDRAMVLAGSTARFMARGGDDSVEIGGTPDTPPEHHAALAEPIQATWDANAATLNDVINSLNEARIELGLPPMTGAVKKFPPTGRSSVVKVK